METWNIAGHDLEFLDPDHLYVCDGEILPSITQIIRAAMPNLYGSVPRETLNRAAAKGTAVHKAIEEYCKEGKESELPELRGFKFLQKSYKFEVLQNEVPVILAEHGHPIAAGRLDLVLRMNDQIGGADIKRTYSLNKEYLGYQLNLYRLAYEYSYGETWEFLRAVHVREDKRKFVKIPINEAAAWEAVEEWRKNARHQLG